MKYDTEISFESQNTVTMMIDCIKDASKVLEFGCASGRLTRYLKEKKNCEVFIVEIDEEAGTIAQQYAVKSLIGEEKGDIEKQHWEDAFEKEQFDYILFADVLEHLHSPEKVLFRAKKYLKENGRILVSIPNICHNSVIMGMMKGDFEYQETGILDRTHIHFWTEASFEKMLEKLGLYPVKKMMTYTQVGYNEFPVKYDDMLPQGAFLWKSRNQGECYQFVYEISAKQAPCEVCTEKTQEYYYSQWFYIMEDTAQEDYSVKEYYDFQENEYAFQIKVPQGCKKLRFDPLNCICAVQFLEIAKKVGEDWISVPEAEIESNASFIAGDMHIFMHDDSQVIIANNDQAKKEFKISVKLFLIDNQELTSVAQPVRDVLEGKRILIEQKENYIQEQRETLSDRDDKIRELNGTIEQKENYICEQRGIIEQKENYICEQRGIIEQKENYICEQRGIIEQKENYICEQRGIIEQKENYICEQRGVIEQKENYICEQRGVIEQKENYICEQREIINHFMGFSSHFPVNVLYKLYKKIKREGINK